MTTVHLAAHAITIDGVVIDPLTTSAVSDVVAALGETYATTVAGVRGSPRTAHWQRSGTVVVSQRDETELVSVYFCFDALDSSPYPATRAEVVPFVGTVEVAKMSFNGGESEARVREVPGCEGFTSLLSVRLDPLYCGFDLRRPLSPMGRRVGPLRLVQISASWLGVKPLPDAKK